MREDLFSSGGAESGEFSFNDENEKYAKQVIAKYPVGRQASALIPLLDLAQRQNSDWLPSSAIEYVAKFIGVPVTRAYEVASFYSMFALKPRGKFLIQICKTTPCWLRGSDRLRESCLANLDIEVGQTSDDDLFTLIEVECLGACVNAPVVQINDDYYENLTADDFLSVLEDLKISNETKVGNVSTEARLQENSVKGPSSRICRGDNVVK
tara:strand:+ start:312 stop:941 length:630 start_codon:yes stop_codon:yes gene_type:complete